MNSPRYVRALERAEFVMGPPRAKGMVIWSGAGMQAVRLLVERFASLVVERYSPTIVEHRFFADADTYRAVFGRYQNAYEVAPLDQLRGGRLLRPDNLVTTVGALRRAGSQSPALAVGGLLRSFPGSTPPLFRDRYIWPAVQLTHRVPRASAEAVLDFYREAVERLLGAIGLPAVTVGTDQLADYGRLTYLVVSTLPDGRPTVLATLYVLADRLRHALGEEGDVIDVGFTGKLFAVCAMLHTDQRGVALPSVLAPTHVGVTPGVDARRAHHWAESMAPAGIRARVWRGCRTLGARNRAERRWHASGAPLVIGMDRSRVGEVILAQRMPLERIRLPQAPAPTQVHAELAAYDARLLESAQAVFAEAVAARRLVRFVCRACLGDLPVFGAVVPPAQGRCDTCRIRVGRRVFVSEEGRFY